MALALLMLAGAIWALVARDALIYAAVECAVSGAASLLAIALDVHGQEMKAELAILVAGGDGGLRQ
jgi:hypothetical protein